MIHRLEALFEPRSIAVFGGSDRPEAVGHHVLVNLLEGGYGGELFVINPKRQTVLGRPSFADLSRLSGRVELALIATPAETVPGILQQCGETHRWRGAMPCFVLKHHPSKGEPLSLGLRCGALSLARSLASTT